MEPAKILIVEDDDIIALHIQSSLRHLGYSVADKTDNGEDGVRLAQVRSPDLVLMDIQLKGSIDGIQAAEAIHRQYSIPVVFLTAYSDLATLTRVKATSPYGYITKPFTTQTLQSSIEIALTRRKLDEEILSLSRFPDEDPYPILRVSDQGRILYANRSSQVLLTSWEISLGGQIPREWQPWLEAALRGEQKVVDIPCSERVFSCTWTPIPDEQYVGVYAYEITEHRRLENELRISETRLRTITEHVQDVILRFDARNPHGLEYISPSIEHMTGFSVREMSETLDSLDQFMDAVIHPDDRTRISRHIYDPAMVTHPILARIQHKDGNPRWFELRFDPEYSSKGDIQAINLVCRDSTARHQAEARLLESEERLRAVVENLPVIVFVIDKEGVFQLFEGHGLTQLNVGPGEMVGQSVYDFFEAFPEMKENIRKVLEGQKIDASMQMGERIYQTRYAPLYADSGEVNGAIGVSSDITDLIVAEQARREGEERFRQLAEAAVEGLAITRAGRFLQINRQFSEMTGYPADELVARDVMQAFAPESNAVVRQTIHNDSSEQFEVIAQRKDGSRFPVEIQVRSMNYGGEMVRVLSLYDISARLEAERSLRETQEKLNMALRSAQMGVWEWDLTSNLISGDDVVGAIYTGLRQPLDVNLEWVTQVIHPDDAEKTRLRFTEAMGSKTRTFEIEYRISWADGSMHTVALRGKVERSGEADATRIVGMCWDVTERRAIEEEIHRLNADLEQRVNQRTARMQTALDELEAFNHYLSHDLRSPLRAMNGYSHVLKEDYAAVLDATGRQYLDRIISATKHMSSLFDGLMELSRYSRMPLHLEEVDLSIMVHAAAQACQRSDPDRWVTWRISDNIHVHADRAMLYVAVTHLVENAWKFSARRSTAEITFGVEVKAGKPIYFIRDNGIGFDMAYASRLFNAFQRLNEMREFEGSGIGLATVKRIIHAHGGEVWADGVVGKGAIFYFTLS